MQQAGGVVRDLHELWTKADASGTGPTAFPHHEHLGLTANGPTELAVELASQLLVLGENTNALVTALRARAATAEEQADGLSQVAKAVLGGEAGLIFTSKSAAELRRVFDAEEER